MKENLRNTVIGLLALLVSLLAAPAAQAQDGYVSVRGTIVDEQGEPLIGAVAMVKGTALATTTDLEGVFTLTVPKGAQIECSYLGYQTQQVKAAATLKVVMKEATVMLNEVVAVGYGMMKRSDVTGSVTSVTGDDLTQTQSASVDQMLQGKAAGVQISLNSGAAGGGSSVQVRGVNSLSSTNEPIYIIDGTIIQTAAGDDVYSNPLSDVNPNDIESIEILKDASATAIYGSQAANGVVIVTMKKGKEGDTKINFKGTWGVEQRPTTISMMNLREYAQWNTEVRRASGYTPSDYFSNAATLGAGTDWQDALFRNAFRHEYNLSARGGTKTLTYSLSGNYFNQQGIVINNAFSRFTLRGSVEVKPYKWLHMGGTFNLGSSDRNTGMASWSTIANVLGQSPNIPIRLPDGTWGKSSYNDEATSYSANPIAVASVTTRLNKVMTTRANVYAELKPLKWLTWRSEYTFDANIDNYRYHIPAYDFGGTVNAQATHTTHKTYNQYTAVKSFATANYKLKRHQFTGMLGLELNSRYRDYLYGTRQSGSDTDTSLSTGDPSIDSNTGYSTRVNYYSYFGRLSYNWANRYLLTTTVRRDGSSRFARGQRWGTFPSVALGWRIDKENFFLPLTETVSNLKLRAGFGVVGNANLADDTYRPTFNVVQSNFGQSYGTANMPNYEGLTWEKTYSWNVGLDLSLLSNRYEMILDLYLKNTQDLLLQTAQPYYTGSNSNITGGTTAQWANIGSMRNRGIEFTFIGNFISRKKWKWRSTFTFTMVDNRITALNTENGYIDKRLDSSWAGNETVTRTAVGHSVSQYYGYQLAGRINKASDFLRDNGDGTSTVIAATPNYRVGTVVSNSDASALSTSIGDFLFRDRNGDGIIDDSDMTFLGTALPLFTLGWNNQLTVHQFKFSLFCYAPIGGKVFNFTRRKIDEPSAISGSYNNKSSRVVNYARWAYLDGNSGNRDVWNVVVADGANPLESRVDDNNGNYNSRVSDRYVEDGTFLRIKTLSCTYSVPKRYTKKWHLSTLNLTLSLQNLYTLTRYSGYDPEVGSNNGQYSFNGSGMLLYGVDTGRIPSPRTVTFTLDTSF
jgi:TonB-linked SusC/RagA family outer membrane protein